ncbi:hypothetical protein M0R72_06690 [Candidatus Pacearchaeota archaeon]|jgi:UDP-3-O-[3-hydroxymyristoyl] glucosamine N-acyltransferase|nr:hypothetical protein [Candidatus Pacearchaeota archaeon]
MKLSDIVAFLGPGHRLVGPDVEITGIGPLDGSGPADLSFCSGKNLIDLSRVLATKAGAVVAHDILEVAEGTAGPSMVLCADPKLSFVRVLREFFAPDYDENMVDCPFPIFNVPGVPSPKQTVSIGFYSVVASIATIGKNVTIHNHVSIGQPGFNYVRDPDGRWAHFPHLGGVVIGNDVDIYPFANIDRGVLSDTIIGNGVKIDHHVHVAHNAVIGDNTILIAHTVVGGSAHIGRGCWIGIGAMIKDNITIGDNVTIGMGAVVLKDVPDGKTVAGNPAKEVR